jgi:hypothetical protein
MILPTMILSLPSIVCLLWRELPRKGAENAKQGVRQKDGGNKMGKGANGGEPNKKIGSVVMILPIMILSLLSSAA